MNARRSLRMLEQALRIQQKEIDVAWWYNILTNKTEEGPGAPNSERLGPFETEQEALSALEKVRERNESWDADSAKWDGDNE